MSKVVMTVDGPISPDDLGFTLCHMHTTTNIQNWHVEPTRSSWMKYKHAKVSMEILGHLRMDPASCLDNLIIDDPDMVEEELRDFKGAGGDTIVDTCPTTLLPTRDPLHQREMMRRTGVNVISASGWYIRGALPAYLSEYSIDKLKEIVVHELTVGCRYNWGDEGNRVYPGFPKYAGDVKAGIIKMGAGGAHEQAFSNEEEEKAFIAGIRAQIDTGRVLSLHPNAHEQLLTNPNLASYQKGRPLRECVLHKYIDLIERDGGSPERFYIHHADQYVTNLDLLRSVMDRGTTLCFDGFNEGQNYLICLGTGIGTQVRERLIATAKLCEEGYADRLVLSNECGMKIHYKRYGGQGYTLLQHYLIPMLQEAYGVSQKHVDTIFRENPKRLLAYEA